MNFRRIVCGVRVRKQNRRDGRKRILLNLIMSNVKCVRIMKRSRVRAKASSMSDVVSGISASLTRLSLCAILDEEHHWILIQVPSYYLTQHLRFTDPLIPSSAVVICSHLTFWVPFKKSSFDHFRDGEPHHSIQLLVDVTEQDFLLRTWGRTRIRGKFQVCNSLLFKGISHVCCSDSWNI